MCVVSGAFRYARAGFSAFVPVVAHAGGLIRYEGNYEDGAMQRSDLNLTPDGTRTEACARWMKRATDRVHHLIEHTANGGKTRTTYSYAVYVPHEQ